MERKVILRDPSENVIYYKELSRLIDKNGATETRVKLTIKEDTSHYKLLYTNNFRYCLLRLSDLVLVLELKSDHLKEAVHELINDGYEIFYND